jgi:cytidyltransferase-like protein
LNYRYHLLNIRSAPAASRTSTFMSITVICAGTFDHFHPGHLDFLRQARLLGDRLIVIVARDTTVQRIKGFRPTDPEEARQNNVHTAGIADQVILGHQDADLLRILEDLRPDVIALGYDQRVNEEAIRTRFPACRIFRLLPFHPDQYKSSYYRREQH